MIHYVTVPRTPHQCANVCTHYLTVYMYPLLVSLPVQISSNGLFSFGSAYTVHSATNFSSSTRDYLVAPFWGDVDLRLAGRVEYNTYTTGQSELNKVRSYIRSQTGNSLSATWMLVAYWNSVPQFSESLSEVSVFGHYGLGGRLRCTGTV